MSNIGSILLSLLLGCGTLLAQESADNLPTALPASRYAALASKSMFAPAAPVASIEAKPSFAADLFVVGLAQFGNKDFVMVINRRTREKFSLVTGEKGPDDVELAGVRWAEDPAQSAVTVKHGPDSSVLGFDEAAFQKPVIEPTTSIPRLVSMPHLPPMPIMPNQPPPPFPVNPQTSFAGPGPSPFAIVRRLRVPGNQ